MGTSDHTSSPRRSHSASIRSWSGTWQRSALTPSSAMSSRSARGDPLVVGDADRRVILQVADPFQPHCLVVDQDRRALRAHPADAEGRRHPIQHRAGGVEQGGLQRVKRRGRRAPRLRGGQSPGADQLAHTAAPDHHLVAPDLRARPGHAEGTRRASGRSSRAVTRSRIWPSAPPASGAPSTPTQSSRAPCDTSSATSRWMPP